MKNEEKQQVKTVGLITLLLVMGLSVLLLAPVWNSESNEARNKALFRAEGLAYQILEGRKGSSRGPASVGGLNHLAQDQGEVGEDPWGHPYKFKLFSHLVNDQAKILVWSSGPNGNSESDETMIDSNRDKASPIFGGDDVGVIVLVK